MSLFNLPVILGFVAVLVVLRVMKASLFVWMLAWWLGMYVLMSRGFATPVPASAQGIYMGIVTLALFAYVTSSAERQRFPAEPQRFCAVRPRRSTD